MSLLYACGSNANGQLGTDARDDAHALTACPLGASGRIRKLSAGGNHAVLLLEDGSLMISGDHSGAPDGPSQVFRAAPPPPSVGPLLFVDVACGWAFSSLVSSAGRVYTFGQGTHGELGLGPGCTLAGLPSLVEGLEGVVKIACGLRHSVALCDDGTVWGWGSNRYGQLGKIADEDDRDSTSPTSAIDFSRTTASPSQRARESWTPIRIHAPSDDLASKIISVSCGQNFTAFLSFAGTVLTFGHNKHAQLGHSIPSSLPFSAIPTSVSNLPSRVVKLSTGWSHVAVLLDTGEVWAWGRNDHGQLGIGHTNDAAHLPAKVHLQGVIDEICCGSEHIVAFEVGRESLFAWGWNEHGNCATGDILDVWEPRVVRPAEGGDFWGKPLRGVGAGCASFWVWMEAS